MREGGILQRDASIVPSLGPGRGKKLLLVGDSWEMHFGFQVVGIGSGGNILLIRSLNRTPR